MKFTKMHGCGNDYIYVDLFKEKVKDPSAAAVALSDRHFGIGSDGLILIAPSEAADCRMIMYNADGTQGEMCGNGVRCVGKYAYDHGIATKESITVETGSGIKTLTVMAESGRAVQLTVDMGAPILEPEKIPADFSGDRAIDVPITVGGRLWQVNCISMGNPHAVVFVEDTADFPLEKYGPLFEKHPCFPNRVNTEFVRVISRDELAMRVWERGSAETLACGTGACASVMAAILNGYTDDRVLIHLLGGDLTIEYNRKNGHIYMTGPATEVFTGETHDF